MAGPKRARVIAISNGIYTNHNIKIGGSFIWWGNIIDCIVDRRIQIVCVCVWWNENCWLFAIKRMDWAWPVAAVCCATGWRRFIFEIFNFQWSAKTCFFHNFTRLPFYIIFHKFDINIICACPVLYFSVQQQLQQQQQ